jgi:Tol biopolymer transport system component
MNPDGSDQRALPTSIQDHEPAWSPDGRKILFTRYPVGIGPNRIYTMNLNGTGLGLVSKKGIPQNPDWGPKPRKKRHRR